MKKQRLTLADLPEKYQQQVAAQILPQATVAAAKQEAHKPTIKQRRGMPSKLEMAFAVEYQAFGYRHQDITLKVANGVRYTPDFFRAGIVVEGDDSKGGVCVEIKGKHRFDGSIEKLKCAASAWPEFEFWLVTRPDGSKWNWERVIA